jgi:hypothetical protein
MKIESSSKKIGISIPFTAIKNVENMDEKRITKTRVFLTGFIVGLLWKKKFLYTVIDYNDGTMDQTIILDFGSGTPKFEEPKPGSRPTDF